MAFMSFIILLNILIISSLNYLINCLPPFQLALLLENSLILLFGVSFIVFPLWLLLCMCFYVVGRSARTLVQAFVRCCQCLAQINLFGAISDTQCVAPSAGPVCVQKVPGSVPQQAFNYTGPWRRSAKVSWSFQRPTSVVKLSSDIASSYLYSAAQFKIYRAEQSNSCKQAGLLLPLRLMPFGEECSA